jgi:hypothetical protein
MATTKQQRAQVHARLKRRWARLLESEMDSDGFWAEVAEGFGRPGVDELTEAERRFAHACLRAAWRWLERLPEPVEGPSA